MKRFQEQFSKQADSVSLSASEQQDLRERVLLYMEYHPLPEATRATASDTAGTTTSVRRHFLANWYARGAFGGVLACLLVLVPIMAERSLPGDVLYAVKVGFNEEVRSTVTRSPFERVEWETERISRRLAEAQALAQAGRLTEVQEERVAEAVRHHSQSARASIERLRAEDEDEAAMAEIALVALFDVHAAVLRAYSTEPEHDMALLVEGAIATTTTRERRSALADAIEQSRAEAIDPERTERPSYEGLLARIEIESARASELLRTIAPLATEEAMTSITRRLADVDRKVQTGITAYENGEPVEARVALTEALTTTRKVITFMSNLEVRNTVDLDMLVPIEYTAEELAEQLHFKRERLQVRYEYIESVVAEYVEAEDLVEIEEVLAEVPTQLAQAAQYIEEESFEAAGIVLADVDELLSAIVQQADIPDRLPEFEIGTTTPTNVEPASATTSTATSSDADVDAATSTATTTDRTGENATSTEARATSTEAG